VLIGAFTILGFLSALGFVLWLAKVQLDRTYAQYDILFDTVAGLGQAGDVRYNGVDVGKVLTIALDRTDPSLVRVRIEIYASTPVRADTIATLASQGVTGVSFIALEGGSAEAERLEAVPPADVPVILSEKSAVQDLMIDAPDLLAEAIALIAEVRGFATPENRDAVAAILADAERATGRIDALAKRAEATLARADAALAAAEASFAAANGLMRREIPNLISRLQIATDDTAGVIGGIDVFAQRDLPRLTAQVGTAIEDARGAIAAFDTLTEQIGSDPGRFLLGNQTPEYRRAQ
jgi:phospholipid/cholesterol/gamma-HCH transport system substrate-binding protein